MIKVIIAFFVGVILGYLIGFISLACLIKSKDE